MSRTAPAAHRGEGSGPGRGFGVAARLRTSGHPDVRWPTTPDALAAAQQALAAAAPPPWHPDATARIGSCFVCFERGAAGPGRSGDRAWAAAACGDDAAVVRGVARAAYEPGLLALREGPLLEAAVRALPSLPDVLLVDATGRDHPRGAGLALQLGAILALPTVGVTHRPLLASGAWPPDERGSRTPEPLRRARQAARAARTEAERSRA